jgi:hypothetical protein
VQLLAEAQVWHPAEQLLQVPLLLTKLLGGQEHWFCAVLVSVGRQVMQEVELRQTWQLGPQGEQNLTPAGVIEKKVWLGQLQVPAVPGVAKVTQEVQLVAELQVEHPEGQGRQVLVGL